MLKMFNKHLVASYVLKDVTYIDFFFFFFFFFFF